MAYKINNQRKPLSWHLAKAGKTRQPNASQSLSFHFSCQEEQKDAPPTQKHTHIPLPPIPKKQLIPLPLSFLSLLLVTEAPKERGGEKLFSSTTAALQMTLSLLEEDLFPASPPASVPIAVNNQKSPPLWPNVFLCFPLLQRLCCL